MDGVDVRDDEPDENEQACFMAVAGMGILLGAISGDCVEEKVAICGALTEMVLRDCDDKIERSKHVEEFVRILRKSLREDDAPPKRRGKR
jgi:xanthine/CO dehydrogenase XdhC/CoxF family maturation factor